MKNTSLLLIFGLLLGLAVQISAVKTTSQTALQESSTSNQDEGQCEFSVTINQTTPNCSNVYDLIEVTSRQLTILIQAKQLTITQIASLEQSYAFIEATCEEGVYGIETLSLIQVSDKFQKYNEQVRSVLPSTDLLEKKALTAFMSAGELLEDAAHCTEEEVKARCEEYLLETSQTIAVYSAFLQEIIIKIELITNRTTYIQQWLIDNTQFCSCSNPDTYTDQSCCDIAPFSETLKCVCHNDYTQEVCCDIAPYSQTTECKCYHDDSDLDLCCPLSPYANQDKCVCRDTTQFTTERCCNINPYKNSDVRCTCAHEFTTTPCCDLEEYKYVHKKCICLGDYFEEECCGEDGYPDDYRCTCEFGDWNTNDCCQYDRYSEDPRCQCLSIFELSPCCSYGNPFNETLECECHKVLENLADYVKCCDQPQHEITNPHCVCLNEATFEPSLCCGFDEHKNKTECLCRNAETFTTDPCCDYDEFKDRHACVCLNQEYPIEGDINCCDQPQFISNNHTCRCLRQCKPLYPDNCCDISPFDTTIECKCFSQEHPLTPLHCCEHAPFNLEDSQWKHECECAGRTDPYDSQNQALNCCDIAPFNTNNLQCKCDKEFDVEVCCQSEDFVNDARCACWAQNDDPLSPKDCCHSPKWINHPECLCRGQSQASPFAPYECCGTGEFLQNHLCICRDQEDPIEDDSNCCDTTYHSNSAKCRCQLQENALTPENCCGYKDFSDNNFACKCVDQYEATGYVYLPDGYDCCNLTEYASYDQCTCRKDQTFDPDYCCQYLEVEANHEHECYCNALTAPVAECCDYEKFVEDPFCLCQPQKDGDPLSPRDCCAYFPDDIRCKCQNAAEPFFPGQSYNCCNTTNFLDDKRCLCKAQAENDEPLQPYDCCEHPRFRGDERCICNSLNLSHELPVSSSYNCCALAGFEDEELCECFNTFNAENCCKYSFFDERIECKCARQTTSPDQPESCCEYAPWIEAEECKCRKQSNAFEPIACCDYQPWDKNHECLCENSIYAKTEGLDCCDYAKFVDDIVCICENPDNATKLQYCCGQPGFENDLECICKNHHELPIFNNYNCCTLESHRTDTLCECEAEFVADKCCGFYPDRHECKCLKGDEDTPILDCCDVDGFETRQECLCQNAFTVQPCCDYPVFETRAECTCYLQDNAFNDTFCCNDTKFIDTHACICYGVEDPSVVQRDGRDCCDTVSADNHNCVCKRQTGPFGEANCCDQPRFANDTRCTCENPPAPLSSIDCCADERFEGYHDCQCKDAIHSYTPAIGNEAALNCCNQTKFAGDILCDCFTEFDSTKCCGFDDFKDHHDCICQVQQNSHEPEDCCDKALWAYDHWCVCRDQIEVTGDFATPKNCCDYNTTAAASHVCKCAVQSHGEPNTPEKCCDTKYFSNNVECLCENQANSLEPVNCCDYRDESDPECYCKALIEDYSSNGVYNCCLIDGYSYKPECHCYEEWHSSCCQYDAFSNEHECLCKAQTVAITEELNCCDQPLWNSTLECKCSIQSIHSPTAPEYCCDQSPFSQTDVCKCLALDTPTNDEGIDCCRVVDKFDGFPGCYCSELENPTLNQTCCNLSPYSESEDCVCNYVQETPVTTSYNCCEYERFEAQAPCICYQNETFIDKICCELEEFKETEYCEDHYEPPCDRQLSETGKLSMKCCKNEIYATNPLCCAYGMTDFCCSLPINLLRPDCCPYKSDPVGEGYNCCDSEKFVNNEECLCRQQSRPISADCCELNPHNMFTTYHECICNSQDIPIDYAQEPASNCCDTDKFKNDHRCLCAKQVAETGNYLSPIPCCDVSTYATQHECICASQVNPFPNDCCESTTHQNNPHCKCAAQKATSLITPVDCCALAEYMSYEQCQCRRHFTAPKCCVYDPEHTGCKKEIGACYANDTILVDYEEVVENYAHNSETITIIDGLIFFNPLINSDHQTIQLLNGNDVFDIYVGGLTSNGLSSFTTQTTVHTAELPWEGTFSVNVWINKDNAVGDITVFSTSLFSVVLQEEENAVQYTVRDPSGATLATVLVNVEAPEDTWWTHLKGTSREAFFNSSIPQKVELTFEGRDCWLTVISINDKVFESEVWRGLVPAPDTFANLGADNSLEIRAHFGTFTLGGNNAENAISLSYVYMIARPDESLRLLTPYVEVAPYDPLSGQNTNGACSVSFDWSRISLIPNTFCQDAATSVYGSVRTVQYSHSFRHVPSYRFCGVVTQAADDLALKSHICDACECAPGADSNDVNLGTSTLSLGITDLIALSSNFEDYNPTITFGQNTANLYLVADYEAGIRSIFPLNDINTVVSAQLTFDFAITSFPNEVYNAYHPTPIAELVCNIRLLGQKTITVVFYVKRDGNTQNFQVSRKLEGALRSAGINSTIITGTATSYTSNVSFNWDDQTTQNEVADSLSSGSANAASPILTYSDETSSEVEVSFQTYLSFGSSHGFFKQTGFVADRNTVFKITGLNLQINRA